jgi:putative flippase GtrA
MRRLARLYDYRIVNVNVNILVAGAAALGITVGVMQAAAAGGLLGTMSRWVDGRQFSFRGYEVHADKLVLSGLTLVVDLVADVAVYYGLHWLANHMPRTAPRRKDHPYADLSFMRDATLVQFERALLSPVLYIIALGLQSKMLHEGYGVATATAVGFTVGIICSRALHTLWMLRAERRAGRRSAADIVGPDPQAP